MRWICALLCFLPGTLLAEWRVLDRQQAEPGDGEPFRLKVTDGSKTAELLLIAAHPSAFTFRVVSNDEGRYGSVEDAARAEDAVAGVNGGGFLPDGTPGGVLIRDKPTFHKILTPQLFSPAFFFRAVKPFLVPTPPFSSTPNQ